jgi:hypothetical protein
MRTSWIISIAAAGALASACATTPEAPKTPTFAATLALGAGITSTGRAWLSRMIRHACADL